MMAAQLALTQRHIELVHRQLDVLGRIEQLLKDKAIAEEVIEQLVQARAPADAALSTPARILARLRERPADGAKARRDYRRGKSGNKPTRKRD